MKEMKFKIFLLAMAILVVGSTTWFSWQHYQMGKQAGLKEGEVYVEGNSLVLGADASEGGIRIAEEGEEGFFLSSEVVVPVPFSIVFTGDDEDWIEVWIVSENYGTGESFLFKVAVGEEQVGIVYFDENEHIQFEGDKEKFERALLKILRARVDFWKVAEEGWNK